MQNNVQHHVHRTIAVVLNGPIASAILMWTKHFIYIIHRFIYRSMVSFEMHFPRLLLSRILLVRMRLALHFFSLLLLFCLTVICNDSLAALNFTSFENIWDENFNILLFCVQANNGFWFFGLGKTPDMRKTLHFEMHHLINRKHLNSSD